MELRRREGERPVLREHLAVVLAAAAVATSALLGLSMDVPVALVAGLVIVAVVRRPVVIVLAVAAVTGARADDAVAALAVPAPERVDGIAVLVSDPAPRFFALQAIVDVDGRRYVADIPNDQAGAVRSMLTGERVRLEGRTRDLDDAPRSWVLSRHLAGRLSVRSIEPYGSGPPWYRAANLVHRTISTGAGSMGDERASLYTGLVLGDDRAQSDLVRFRFEASGLTHLLAVSGQNVAFVLAVAAPLLRRAGPRSRLVASGVLLVLFVLVTRAEPSVLRAAVMAAVAIAAVTSGRAVSGLRVLCLTVMAVLVVDPLLVHSVGFRLSVCATGGLLVLAGPLADRLPGPEWLRLPLAVTIAAQVATAPLLLALAGGVPSVAVVTNLLAGPAAGAVMMLGVTVGMLAGVVRQPWSGLLQIPTELLVRWVDWVAAAGSRAPMATLGPARFVVLLCVGVLAVVVARRIERAGPRVVLVVVAASVALWAVWPPATPVGRHDLGNGSSVSVGDCGVVVEVHGAAGPGDALESLWHLGVRRADLVVAGEGQRNRAAAAVVAEQFDAAVRTVDDASRPQGGAAATRPACG